MAGRPRTLLETLVLSGFAWAATIVSFAAAGQAIGVELTTAQAALVLRWTLEPAGSSTRVTVRFENVPPGLRLEDNEEGSRLTLEQLARFLEG